MNVRMPFYVIDLRQADPGTVGRILSGHRSLAIAVAVCSALSHLAREPSGTQWRIVECNVSLRAGGAMPVEAIHRTYAFDGTPMGQPDS
jgi:hypothetical protein